MFGVGMGAASGLKTLNSGWQVWGNGTPTSKRNASISSAASVADDGNYRANLSEGWNTGRSASGAWEEVNGSPQKKDLSQLDSLSLHHARQRQVSAGFPAARIDDRTAGVSKPAQYSPQRFETGTNKETNTPARYASAASPPKPGGFSMSSPFSGQQALQNPNTAGYDAMPTSSIVENELSLGIRGMAVEDDYGVAQQGSPYRQQPSSNQPAPASGVNPSVPQIRGPPPMQQPRGPYNVYAQTDYATYYSGQPSGRESYVDYSYPYDAYRGTPDPSLYASTSLGTATSPVNVYPSQPGVFYDYSGPARPPGSQFYYPTQPMVYHAPPSHSPMLTPQLAASVPATLSDKKRELQYNLQQHQQMTSQGLIYPSLRSSPSPHQAYAGTLDYGSQLPLMLPGGAMYAGLSPHMYQQGMHSGRRREGDTALRSPLLDEFRANKSRKWELRDIFGYVVEFSGDQHGSRFIQQKLETATSEEKQVIFEEIVPDNALQLIQDVFGNYVIQKLFEHGTQVQKTVLANAMETHILALSMQMYGCRVVQKAVEYVLPEQQALFVKELEPHVLKCVKDANGNHVIQKLIERVSPERLAFVNSFRGNVYELSTHPYGCRVLQRCFEHLGEEQTRPLLDELHKYTINLMQDQFGNYVVQFVLEHGKPQDRALIISKLRGQMLHMSRHKFASNVCEKALVMCDSASRRQLIDEMMTPKQDGVSPIVTMMKDQFANYVLQRALVVVESDQKEELISKIKPQLITMRRYSSAYSKHLIAIERLLEKAMGQKASEDLTSATVQAKIIL
ncbi:hypothetical protein EW146_g4279 [Bondarzewia mesenterica]|uniref:Pumilio homology domain family member 3 n=1 Tax=Bondarzewia mesenterica TaxID=1095465 RepID=A0A4S4LX84_9AGAM|nr:hypothetical protein EW146_g4279 [Bondarzewia mesenterica]